MPSVAHESCAFVDPFRGDTFKLKMTSPIRLVCHGIVALLCLSLSACFLVPHKIDVQQGNYVDQAMLDKLRLGMSKSQVRFVLGTPLIADPFHPERWDYAFQDRPGGKLSAAKRVTAIFEDDKLSRLEGDVPSALTGSQRVEPAEPIRSREKGN